MKRQLQIKTKKLQTMMTLVKYSKDSHIPQKLRKTNSNFIEIRDVPNSGF